MLYFVSITSSFNHFLVSIDILNNINYDFYTINIYNIF